MSFDWKDASKGNWTSATQPLDVERYLAVGALQRIADAAEKLVQLFDPTYASKIEESKELDAARKERWKPIDEANEKIRKIVEDAWSRLVSERPKIPAAIKQTLWWKFRGLIGEWKLMNYSYSTLNPIDPNELAQKVDTIRRRCDEFSWPVAVYGHKTKSQRLYAEWLSLGTVVKAEEGRA